MKNTASIYNNGESVFFDSKIRLPIGTKIILVLMNLLFLAMVVFLTMAMSDDKTGGRTIIPYVILPAVYVFTLGRISLWNFFGEEQIIVNVKTIMHRKNFGFFQTSYKTIQFKKLRSCLNEEKIFNNRPYGTISFFDNTKLDIPVPIFSSSIYVPMDVLDEFYDQLDFVFCIEHLTQNTENSINLN